MKCIPIYIHFIFFNTIAFYQVDLYEFKYSKEQYYKSKFYPADFKNRTQGVLIYHWRYLLCCNISTNAYIL